MNLWINLCFVAVALMLIDADDVSNSTTPSEKPTDKKKSHPHSGSRSSESCETCKATYKFQCNDNEWLPYMLDDAPAEEGIFYGDYGAGNPGFVGCGGVGDERLPARIQILEPKGAFEIYGKGETFINDSAHMWYLKRNCEHQYTWESSLNGQISPYGVEPISRNVNGYPIFVGRKVIDKYTVAAGKVLPLSGTMSYVSTDGQRHRVTDFEVLVCRSKKFEQPPKVTPPPAPLPGAEESTGCVHEWKQFSGSNNPDVDGIYAGLFDIDNKAYVGKTLFYGMWFVGRIQTSSPSPGIYTSGGSSLYYNKDNGYYLVNNPKYHYYWVDSYLDNVVPNGVKVKLSDQGLMSIYIGRVQVDGQMQVATVSLPVGLSYSRADGVQDYVANFQILACEPIPVNACKQQWKPYKNDNAPSTEGIVVDAYKDDIVSYVGRSDNKYVRGDDYTVGRVQIAPASASGVYTLNAVSGVEKFDPSSGEYLVKNPNDAYKWVNSHTGDDVKFALKVPMTAKGEYRHYDHAHTAFIGRAYINNIAYVGTVYRDKGLAFFNVGGHKSVISSYQVLTCTSTEPYVEVNTDSHGFEHEIEWFDEEFSSNDV